MVVFMKEVLLEPLKVGRISVSTFKEEKKIVVMV